MPDGGPGGRGPAPRQVDFSSASWRSWMLAPSWPIVVILRYELSRQVESPSPSLQGRCPFLDAPPTVGTWVPSLVAHLPGPGKGRGQGGLIRAGSRTCAPPTSTHCRAEPCRARLHSGEPQADVVVRGPDESRPPEADSRTQHAYAAEGLDPVKALGRPPGTPAKFYVCETKPLRRLSRVPGGWSVFPVWTADALRRYPGRRQATPSVASLRWCFDRHG